MTPARALAALVTRVARDARKRMYRFPIGICDAPSATSAQYPPAFGIDRFDRLDR